MTPCVRLRRTRRIDDRSTRTCRGSRSSLGHTWIRGPHQLNDFRFQYAHAAFYGYPGGTEIFTKLGEFPDRVRIARRPAVTAFRP